MNHKKHYNNLISRCKSRYLQSYTEKHHIIPICMGGTNDKFNIVKLTAREHFIAHLLLTKIYPENKMLWCAVNMMCMGRERYISKNRMYGWLREEFSKSMKILQGGKNNSQFGKIWIFHEKNKQSKKIEKNKLESYINKGWKKGRKIKFKDKICSRCGQVICKRPNVCGKHQIIKRTLSVYFGFDMNTWGTLLFYEEYDKIIEKLNYDYHSLKMSTIEMTRKYNLTSSQRLDSIFKSLGIKPRTHKEALRNYIDKKSRSVA